MILIDTHTHYYDCFDLSVFLDSAWSHFQRQAAHMGERGSCHSLLVIADGKGGNGIERLSKSIYAAVEKNESPMDHWRVHETEEDCSLCLERTGGGLLFLIAGQQIVTFEKLETLSVGASESVEEGQSIEDTLETIREAAAIPIIPWGAGKWFAYRGTILERLLEESDRRSLFLGDTGARPAFWPRPGHFKKADSRGIAILSGSDPLPFASEARRAGSYGSILPGRINRSTPYEDLKRLLTDEKTTPVTYGRLMPAAGFLRNQLRARLKKRGTPGR